MGDGCVEISQDRLLKIIFELHIQISNTVLQSMMSLHGTFHTLKFTNCNYSGTLSEKY